LAEVVAPLEQNNLKMEHIVKDIMKFRAKDQEEEKEEATFKKAI
jgi:hypothetical protein